MGRVLLVRHGQASFGAADYDVLSATGRRQAEMLGATFARGGVRADALVHGTPARQRETALLCAAAAGWTVVPETDAGWDEIDAFAIAAASLEPAPEDPADSDAFQVWFEAGLRSWAAGQDAPGETYAEFAARVDAALRRTTERAGTTVVVSSGGPIARVVAGLLAADSDHLPVYHRLTPVVVNTGVTRIVVGRRGTTLVSFNEHGHLDGHDGMLTYR